MVGHVHPYESQFHQWQWRLKDGIRQKLCHLAQSHSSFPLSLTQIPRLDTKIHTIAQTWTYTPCRYFLPWALSALYKHMHVGPHLDSVCREEGVVWNYVIPGLWGWPQRGTWAGLQRAGQSCWHHLFCRFWHLPTQIWSYSSQPCWHAGSVLRWGPYLQGCSHTVLSSIWRGEGRQLATSSCPLLCTSQQLLGGRTSFSDQWWQDRYDLHFGPDPVSGP